METTETIGNLCGIDKDVRFMNSIHTKQTKKHSIFFIDNHKRFISTVL